MSSVGVRTIINYCLVVFQRGESLPFVTPLCRWVLKWIFIKNLCTQRRTKIICAAAFAVCNIWNCLYADGKAYRFFSKNYSISKQCGGLVSVNKCAKCTKQLLWILLKLTLGRNAACLIIGKNFEKSYSVQAHTQKQLPLMYALAIAAQIAFARRYVRMDFEKFPNY